MYFNYKKGTEQTHEVFTRYIPAIWMTCPYGFDIPGINHEYTMYIKSIWTYGFYIPGIYHVYTMYIQGICDIPFTYQTYTLYIQGIYKVYMLHIHSILLLSTPPGGWCCGGGHGPIPPEPPAITSPGRVMIFILLHS